MRTCAVTGCHEKHYGNGLCNTHYARVRKNGSVELQPRVARRCDVPGCDRPHVASGLCRRHYSRKYKRGTVELTRPTFADRFWSKVDKSGDCWLWTAHRDKDGYGTFSVGPRKTHRTVRAHRIAWGLTHGPIPDGMMVLHRCDTPPCVNPSHLSLGDGQENVDDMVSKRRQALGTKNGKYTRPDRTPRGDAHWKRRMAAIRNHEGALS